MNAVTENRILKLRKAGIGIKTISKTVGESRNAVTNVISAKVGAAGRQQFHPSQVSQTPLKVVNNRTGPLPCSKCGLPHTAFVADTDRVCLACHLRAKVGHDRNRRETGLVGQGSRVGE